MRFSLKIFCLLGAALCALAAVGYFFWSDEPAPARPPSAAATTPFPLRPARPVSTPTPTVPAGPRFAQGAPYQAPALVKRPPQITTVTAADVERDFAAATNPKERAALAETIAAQRDPETFTILSRLYARETVPTVREALIAGLAEVDEDEHTAAKITLLGTALKKEPRNGRRAALEVLAQIDDPQAKALLKKAAKEDADFQIREAAKAFISEQ